MAVDGLAKANADLRIAKGVVESGRTHSERLQTAVTRQAQALKEYNRADLDHTALLEKVDVSDIRLAASVASLAEADEALKSLHVEGAGPLPVPPIPAHLQSDTFFAVWNEVATRLGWALGDPATFNAMAAALFAQVGSQPGVVPPVFTKDCPPGHPVGPAPRPPAPQPVPGQAATGSAAAASAPQAAAAPHIGTGPLGPTPRESQGMGFGPAGRSRSAGPGRYRRPTGLDAHFNTTGVSTPCGGAWAAPPPPFSEAPLDASGYSTPHSQRSRSRSPGVHFVASATGASSPVAAGTSH
jgi:hypothetical protein